jgi:uncharacterized phiE125 gp8 family phage protein
MRQLRRLTDTPSEQFLLEAALSHLRVTDGAEVPLLLHYLAAAREVFERLTGRALMTQTYELALSDWSTSNPIELGRSPVSAVSSLTYLDENDVTQTVTASNYVLHTAEDTSAVLVFRDAFTYPTLSDRPDSVKVAFTAGNASFSSVPYSQRQAILFLAAHLYELRTPINVGNIVNEVPMTLSSLITMNRIGGFIG